MSASHDKAKGEPSIIHPSRGNRRDRCRLLGEFLLSCLGKNDMSVCSGFIAAAAMLAATHCELGGLLLEQFDLALQVAGEHSETKTR